MNENFNFLNEVGSDHGGNQYNYGDPVDGTAHFNHRNVAIGGSLRANTEVHELKEGLRNAEAAW
jgi:hypothetical protein